MQRCTSKLGDLIRLARTFNAKIFAKDRIEEETEFLSRLRFCYKGGNRMEKSFLKLSFIGALSFFGVLASNQNTFGASEASWSNVPDLPAELVRSTGVYFPPNGRFYAMG